MDRTHVRYSAAVSPPSPDDLPDTHTLERLRRSMAMLPHDQKALTAIDACHLYEQLIAALLEVKRLRGEC
jgi:hypothetical protein